MPEAANLVAAGSFLETLKEIMKRFRADSTIQSSGVALLGMVALDSNTSETCEKIVGMDFLSIIKVLFESF